MDSYAWSCCRLCLSDQSLHHIFAIKDHCEMYTEVVFATTGITVKPNDRLPQQICTNCTKFINESTSFRQRCKEVQRQFTTNHHQLLDFRTQNYINVSGNSIQPDGQSCQKSVFCQNYIKHEITDHTINISHLLAIDSTKLEIENCWDGDLSVDKLKNDIFVDEVQSTVKIKESTSDQFILDPKSLKCNVKDCEINIEFDSNWDQNSIKNSPENKQNSQELKQNSLEFEQNSPNVGKDVAIVKKVGRGRKKNGVDTKVGFKKRKRTVKKAEEKDEINEGESMDRKTASKEAIECEICQKVLTSRLSLRNHYKIHTGFDVVCEHCGKKFITRRLLLMHCRAKHGYEKTDKCSFCDYRASNAEQVKIHERLHTGEKPFVCSECGAAFHRKSSYLQHVATHLPEKTVQCDQCPARFKSVTLMRIHKHRHRATQYTFQCGVCNVGFARRRNAARHLQRVHQQPADDQNITRLKIA